MSCKITYIGHATCLIELEDAHFLTDPNFSNKTWPKRHRLQPPGLPAYQIPKLDAILISQAKYDHLDLFSLKYFKTATPIIAPKGLGGYIRKFFPGPVTELKKNATHQQGSIKIHSVPIEKRGDRLIFFRLMPSLGYVLESSNHKIYFAGDTGVSTGNTNYFKKVGKKFDLDVALLPIQPKLRRERGPFSSLSPSQALKAFEDLGAKTMIPIRWDAFAMGKENPETYLTELKRLAQKQGLSDRIKILKPGESYLG